MGDPMTRLLDLDSRHTELLDRLAALDQQVTDVLNDWTRSKELIHKERQKYADSVGGENDVPTKDDNNDTRDVQIDSILNEPQK